MTDDAFDKRVALEEELQKLDGSIKLELEVVDGLLETKRKFLHGCREAERVKKTLKAAPVLSLGEYRMVRDLSRSCEVNLKKTEETLAVKLPQLEAFKALLQKTVAELKKMDEDEARIPNNVLEFPRNEVRRSEEED